MRYFVHVRKTVAYATLQLSRAVLTHLRGGRTDGEIRVRGVSLYARGFGWYRIYGDVAQRGLDRNLALFEHLLLDVSRLLAVDA